MHELQKVMHASNTTPKGGSLDEDTGIDRSDTKL